MLTAQTPTGSSRDPLSLPRLPWDNTVTQTHLVSKAPTFHRCPQTQWMVFSNESAVLREGRHHVTFVTPAKAREVFTERAREGEETDRQMTRKKEGWEHVQHSRGPGRRDKRYPAQRDAPAPRAPTSPLTTTRKSRGFDKPCLEVNEVAALRHHELCCLGAAG